MNTTTLAIDFGTTRTKVAWFDEQAREPRLIDLGLRSGGVLPSVFYLPMESTGRILLGDEAQAMTGSDPAGLVSELKRDLHKPGKIRLGPGRIAIEREQLAALLFRYLRERCQTADAALTSCCLTVPATFGEPQREAIRRAATLGGFRDVTLLEEPVAAAQLWLAGVGQKISDHALVCDAGRTTDLTLVHLVNGRYRSDPRVIPEEAIPHAASEAEAVAEVAEAVRGFARKCADVGVRNVPILLTGGGAQLKGLRETVEQLKAGPVFLWQHAEFAAVLGAAAHNPIAARTTNTTAGPEGLVVFEQAVLMAAADGKVTTDEIARLQQIVREQNITRAAVIEIVSQNLKKGAQEIIRELTSSARQDTGGAMLLDSVALKAKITADLEAIRKAEADLLECDETIPRLAPHGLEAWKQAAAMEWPEGQWLLGECYYNKGTGLEHNPAAAVQYFERAAKGGFAKAQVSLATCYANGEGVSRDPKKAATLLKSAFETGEAFAGTSLGTNYLYGTDVAKDEERAFQLLTQALRQGCNWAHFHLGLCYLTGRGVQQAEEEAQRHFQVVVTAARRGANSGGKSAQCVLGLCYQNGRGVEANPKIAAEWFKRAADQGAAGARVALGNCYYFGSGVVQDTKLAMEFFRKAADQGHVEGQTSLANLLLSGKGGVIDPPAAREWFRKAAEKGDAEGAHEYGKCLVDGIGGEQDIEQALVWIQRAAEQSHAGAQNTLGLCHEDGIGVPADWNAAFRCFTQAAQQGFADGIFNQARCHFHGAGTVKDFDKAESLLRTGAEAGHIPSMAWLGAMLASDRAGSEWNEGVEWLNKAAEAEHPMALYELGICYVHGRRIPKNEGHGIELIRRAAELNHASAQCFMGYRWLQSEPVEAEKWFRKSAEQGDYHGQIGLGLCYFNGWGVGRDIRTAAQWFKPAADAGIAEAMTNLGRCHASGLL